MLLNTSFNIRGKPFVNTPDNTLYTFSYSELDMQVMRTLLIESPAGYCQRLPEREIQLD